MTIISVPAAAEEPLLALACPESDVSCALAHTARLLLPHLERGHRIDAFALRAAMERAFGGSDAAGAWDWKTAYDAREAATVLFLRKFGPAIRAQATSPAGQLQMLGKVAASAHPYAPIPGEPGTAAVLDADRSGLRRRQGGRYRAGRCRARALGRYRLARHLR
jgi:hypothetical protein